MSKKTIRTIGILAGVATILSVCCAAVALVPAFGQWLAPRAPSTSLPTATTLNSSQQEVTEPPVSPNEPETEPASILADTPYPSDTPIPDTPPGTVLEVGQTWRQAGLELTLEIGDIHLGTDRQTGPGILIGFSVTNRRAQQITFRIRQENFFASDNRGRQLDVGKTNAFYGYYFAPPMEERSLILQSGERLKLYDDFDAFFVRVDITDPQLTEITVGATGISGINDARWRIQIFH